MNQLSPEVSCPEVPSPPRVAEVGCWTRPPQASRARSSQCGPSWLLTDPWKPGQCRPCSGPSPQAFPGWYPGSRCPARLPGITALARLFCSLCHLGSHHSCPGVCPPDSLVAIILIPSSLDSTSRVTHLISREPLDHPGWDKTGQGSLSPWTREQREAWRSPSVSQPLGTVGPQTPAFLPQRLLSS